MLRNYFKIALRTIMRSKIYSAINILGLSLGVACCLLLALYIHDEYKVDKHHDRAEDVYRIITVFNNLGDLSKSNRCSPPIAMTMWEEIPEIEVAGRLLDPPGASQNLIRYGENMFYETDGYLADSTIFSIFTYEFIEGTSHKVLSEANSVVLTEKMAHKIFGTESALDKVISITQGGPTIDCKVTGVVREKGKSHRNPHFFVSMTSSGWAEYMRAPGMVDEWGGQNFIPSYLKLIPGHNKDEVIKKMNAVLLKHGAEDMKALGMSKTLSLEPVKDIHLYSDVGSSPRIVYIYVIAAIAVFILLIACINFMNLSTAKATKRAGEIGVRKVMGAFRSSLINQLLGEAMVIVIFSMVISLIIVQVFLPYFNELTGKTISLATDNMFYFGGSLVIIAIVTGLIAGSYPAFYLSSFNPAEVLKGKSKLGKASGILRQGLVIFQFVIGIALICGMLLINKQLSYMSNKNLGFSADAKIVLPLRTGTAQRNSDALQKELGKIASVTQVSAADYLPGGQILSDFRLYKKGENMDAGILHRRNTVDYGYLELMQIPLLAGRSFNEVSDSTNNIVINRTGAKQLGLTPENAIGQDLMSDWQGQITVYHVIGVMEDYHQVSLKEEILPTLFIRKNDHGVLDNIILNSESKNFSNTIASIEEKWKAINPETPFEFTFLDQNLQQQYTEDIKISKIITSFTIIAIVISCLGLYGLSTFMAEKRFKEIGVRKVLGANVNQIVGLMSKEFIKLVLIAFIIAIPIAWYAMDKWLSSFAYKISIDIVVFVYAGAAALVIALLTVSFESFKAAISNPVKALRNE